MGFSKPPGVPCPPNNPHCQGEIPNVPIENYLFMAIIIVLITIYIFYIMKKKQENTGLPGTDKTLPPSKLSDSIDISKSDYQKTSTEILKLYIVSELEKVTDNLQLHDADLETRILEKEDYDILKNLINIIKQ